MFFEGPNSGSLFLFALFLAESTNLHAKFYPVMKKFLSLLLMISLLMACNEQETINGKKSLEINKNWEFRESGQARWLPATVPGTVHTDLLNNKIIEDPYYRLNELSVQWIDKTGWEYRCYFEVGQDIAGYQHQDLVFDGLDTYADVFLNDSLILQADNMFRTWRVDCRKYIKTGKNEIRIVLRSPTREGLARIKRLWESRGFTMQEDRGIVIRIGPSAVDLARVA